MKIEEIKEEILSHKTAWGPEGGYILSDSLKDKILHEIEFLHNQLEGARSFIDTLKMRVKELETPPDCGDHSCLFCQDKHGMRTNGGCRCWKNLGATNYNLLIKIRLSYSRCLSREKELEEGIRSVSELITNSHGVQGLHLNGDMTPWKELLEGGRFEPWLLSFSRAMKLIEK